MAVVLDQEEETALHLLHPDPDPPTIETVMDLIVGPTVGPTVGFVILVLNPPRSSV